MTTHKMKNTDISKMTKTKAVKAAEDKVLRVNTKTPAHQHRPIESSDLGHQHIRDKNWAPRKKKPGEVEAPQPNIWSEGTYDGKELKRVEVRPGSLDFLKYPSKGL